MYNVSQEYIDLITAQKTNIEWNWAVMITTKDGTGYALSMSDLKQGQSRITREIVSGSSLELGTTCSAEISLAIFLTEINDQYYLDGQIVDRYAFFDATIEIEFQLYTQQGIEGVPCGIYTVTDATRTANVLTLTGYDNMLKFSASLSDPEDKTCYEWLSTACSECGAQLGNTQTEIEAMPNGTFITSGYEVSTKVKTWRDMIGHVASMLCGYAYIGRDGKLYIGRYGMTPIRTISKAWRYKSEVADYETYYSSLTFTNDRRNEQMRVEVQGDGLEYTMSDNPLLQYPNSYATERRLKEILNGLASIRYTPFEIQTPMDPALDVGDIIELTEGQTVSGKYAPITSIAMPLNGKMTLKGVGQNPRTQEKSTLEKKIDEMSNTAYAGEARYDHYINDAPIAIADGSQQRVIVLTYEAAKNSHVDFHGEVCFDIEIDEVIDPQTGDITKQADLTVTYYRDGTEVTDYHPQQRITIDGKHLLNLMYFWIQNGNKKDGSFVAWLNVTGGTIAIAEKFSRGYICSQGWDSQNSDSWDDPRYLIYIEVTTLPTKTTYNLGDNLDWDGVQTLAFYSDNTTQDITYDCTYTPAHGSPATQGLTECVVTYAKDGERYSDSFPVIIEGEYDDVYEVNGGRIMIATAGTAMAKGDTVYFENQVGEWTDVTGDVGFLGATNGIRCIAISSDGRKIYSKQLNRDTLYIQNADNLPWDNSIFMENVNKISQVGDIGIIRTSNYHIILIDLLSGETINDITLSGDRGYNIYANEYIFDNYICQSSFKANIGTGVQKKFSSNYNCVSWLSPTLAVTAQSTNNYVWLESISDDGASETLIYTMTLSSDIKYPYTIYTNGKLFIINDIYTFPYMGYVENPDNYPWTLQDIQLPVNFVPSPKFASISADGNSIVIPDLNTNVVAYLDTNTLLWTVVDFITHKDYAYCAMGGNKLIAGVNAFQNTGSGTIAHKAYNNLHGSRSLGYAIEDMTAGQKGRFRELFT